MRKYKNRKERIDFVQKKKGRKFVEFVFPDMTDKEVKQYFNLLYPVIKDSPDLNGEPEIECIRCGCPIEHHFECICGYDRSVFSEEDWKMDIENNNWSEMRSLDEEFIANGYKLN